LLVVILCLSACVTQHRITVSGKALRQRVSTLQSAGRATVDAEHGRDGKLPRRHREELAIDQVIGTADERKPVRSWIEGCTPGVACPLDELATFPIPVRQFETTSAKPVIGGVVFGVVLAGLTAAITCGFACEDGSGAKQASEYTLIGYGVVLGAGLVWLLISCADGKCRD
jgi:hypothetical protein